MLRPLILAAFAAAAIATGVTAFATSNDARTANSMSIAARRFLAALTPEQRQQATFPFTSDERLNWQFRKAERKGVPLKAMNADQRALALELLRTGLSERGLKKAAAIREIEKIPYPTREGSKAPPADPERYFFAFFGDPRDDEKWAWRYEGHHCAINWTLVPGKGVSSTPQFFGSDPAIVREQTPGGPKIGFEPMPGEQNLAFKLLGTLTEAQRREALRSDVAPKNIITGAERQAQIQEDTGLAYSAMTADQRKLLLRLIREYTDNQIKPLAAARVAAMEKAGLEKIKFAWLGGLEPGRGHYYRVQGPTFLIEFDNTGSNANHIHSVWRDFKGDFGTDLLAMHYRESPHRHFASR